MCECVAHEILQMGFHAGRHEEELPFFGVRAARCWIVHHARAESQGIEERGPLHAREQRQSLELGLHFRLLRVTHHRQRDCRGGEWEGQGTEHGQVRGVNGVRGAMEKRREQWKRRK